VPTHPLYISEAQARDLLTMSDALEVLEEAFSLPRGIQPDRKTNLARQRALLPSGFFNVMGATIPELGVFGLKAYYKAGARIGYNVLLYSVSRGELLALIEADFLSQLRTGAASGLATKYMARSHTRKMALIGTGKQAFWQVASVAEVRQVEEVAVYGRDIDKARALADRIEGSLGIKAEALATAEDCVADADIIATITSSVTPVCMSDWVKNGSHINAAGANTLARQEIETELAARCNVLATDDLAQARVEAAEFVALHENRRIDWDRILTLDDLCSDVPGRRNDLDVTLFKSLGVAMEDVALAARLYQRAVANTADEWRIANA